jgi:hypothetical protein
MQHPTIRARRIKAPRIEPMTMPAIAPPLSPPLPCPAAPAVALGVLELVVVGKMLPRDVVMGNLTFEHLDSVFEFTQHESVELGELAAQ